MCASFFFEIGEKLMEWIKALIFPSLFVLSKVCAVSCFVLFCFMLKFHAAALDNSPLSTTDFLTGFFILVSRREERMKKGMRISESTRITLACRCETSCGTRMSAKESTT